MSTKKVKLVRLNDVAEFRVYESNAAQAMAYLAELKPGAPAQMTITS